MVMGDESGSKGRGFESRRRLLDGHFSHLFVVKNVLFARKDENKRKRGMAHILKKRNR